MKKIRLIIKNPLFSMFTAFAVLFVSCNNDEAIHNLNDDESTFKKMKELFDMKKPFSELSKRNIINRYGSAENYLNFVLKRKNEIQKKSIRSSRKNTSINKWPDGYKVTLFMPNGKFAQIGCDENSYILDVAEQWGIDLPYSDRTGASPASAALLREGNKPEDIDQHEQTYLDEDQIRLGFVLLCVASPLSDVSLYTHAEKLLNRRY